MIYDYCFISKNIKKDLQDYLENGNMTNIFLFNLLSNNLFKTIENCQENNLSLLPTYISYIMKILPEESYGNFEKVENWMNSRKIKKVKNDML